LKVLSGYSHLDLNNHVNNAHYIEWVLDAFPAQIHETFQVSRLQVNFQAETKIADRITLYKESFLKTSPGPMESKDGKTTGKPWPSRPAWNGKRTQSFLDSLEGSVIGKPQ